MAAMRHHAMFKKRSRGALLMLLAVVSVSPDSVVVRFLVHKGISQWAMVAWKNIFAATFEGIYVVWEAGSVESILHGIRAGPLHVAAGMLMQAGLGMTFNLALVHTDPAAAILLSSLNPLWSAVLGYFLLGDKVAKQTVIALVVCILSVGVVCLPLIIGVEEATGEIGKDDASHVALSFLGNALAVSAGLFLAGLITISRHASFHCPSCNMSAAVALGSLCGGVGSLLLAEGRVLPGPSGFFGPAWQFWLPMIGAGLGEGIFFVTVSIVPALISGAEIGILSLLEVILGPLFVFLAFGLIPQMWTFVGGSILLLTLALHELSMLLSDSEAMEKPSNQKKIDRSAYENESNTSSTSATDVPFDHPA